MYNNMYYGGASVIGPAHIDCRLPNQDSWFFKKYSWGILSVVADGMGSKKHANIGSKAVCNAVQKAVNIWIKYNKFSQTDQLLKLVHNIWDLEIASFHKNECGTTALFIIYVNSGKLITCQLGDGLIFVNNIEISKQLHLKDDEFSNLTNSIHSVNNLNQWSISSYNSVDLPIQILIATDGVSEDLFQDKINQFLSYIDAIILTKQTQQQKNGFIRSMLTNWPTKFHSDDKTLVYIKIGK